MITALEVFLIILAVFLGIAMVIGVVATSILFANGKLTLPNSSARRLQRAQVDLEVSRLRFMTEIELANIEEAVNTRLTKALNRGED